MIDPDITGLDISRFQLPLPRITESFRFYGLRKPWRRGKQTIAVGNFKPQMDQEPQRILVSSHACRSTTRGFEVRRLLTNIRTGAGHLFEMPFFGSSQFCLFLGTDGPIIILLCDWNGCVGEGVGGNEARTSRQIRVSVPPRVEYCGD